MARNSNPNMSSLADFLSQCKQQVSTTNPSPLSPLSLVIGNVAGDADSILSALCWALVASSSGSAATRTTIPIISIPRHDLTSQRPETLLLLQWANVSPNVLVDATDVLVEYPERVTGAQVTLVDHNRLDTKFDALDWTVEGILDHHADEGLHLDTTTLREIAFDNDKATVASSTTLIAERWLEAKKQQQLDSDVALLLLGTILLDSVNMSKTAGKGTLRDRAVVDALLEQTNWLDGKLVHSRHEHDNDKLLWDAATGRPNSTRLFERLQQAKFDVKFWQALSVRDALRLDYKQFSPNNNSSPFGVSTVLLDWDTFLAKDDVSSGIASYMNDANVSFLAIMCTFTAKNSDNLQRQLILCANGNPSLLASMVDYLQNLDADSNLQLQERNQFSATMDKLQIRGLDQGKVKASRKQVAPLLNGYFEACTV